jgi:hypothetical protein
VRHGAAEDEAARFDARDLVDLLIAPRLDQRIDGERECLASRSNVVMSRNWIPGLG